MKYLKITQEDLQRHPHLARLLWDENNQTRLDVVGCTYWAPEDHPNIAIIACAVLEHAWVEIGIASERQVKIII